MDRVTNMLFTPFWTAGVTVTAVAAARLTGKDAYVASGQRLWGRGLLRTWGVRVETEGLDRLPDKGPYILMANHQSHADVPILFSSLPIIPGFLAKKELGKIPFLAMALRAGGHVLIDRSDRGSAMRALKDAANEISQGKTLAIFPEGTRGSEDRLGPFKRGAFLIAKKAGVPVVPIGILGSRRILHRDAWLPRSGNVRVIAGEPISFDEIRELDSQRMSDVVYERIAALLGWPTTPVRESKAPDSAQKINAPGEENHRGV